MFYYYYYLYSTRLPDKIATHLKRVDHRFFKKKLLQTFSFNVRNLFVRDDSDKNIPVDLNANIK